MLIIDTHPRDESQALEKEWLATQKAEKDPNIVSFDCAENLKFCKDLDVNSFPTIRVYHRDGRMDRFRGERKAKRSVDSFILTAY